MKAPLVVALCSLVFTASSLAAEMVFVMFTTDGVFKKGDIAVALASTPTGNIVVWNPAGEQHFEVPKQHVEAVSAETAAILLLKQRAVPAAPSRRALDPPAPRRGPSESTLRYYERKDARDSAAQDQAAAATNFQIAEQLRAIAQQLNRRNQIEDLKRARGQ